jgi:F-type H+-transporting ATPase subunit b
MSSALLAGGSAGKGGSFLDTLPDPMKPTLFEIGFIIVVVSLLYFFLKAALFGPLGKLMDDRDAEILAGASAKLEAAKIIEARQSEYAEKLKELRNKAFEHRKELAQAATAEKAKLIDKARQDASSVRKDAAEKLAAQREAAKSELLAQVDSLVESMVRHLLKQA